MLQSSPKENKGVMTIHCALSNELFKLEQANLDLEQLVATCLHIKMKSSAQTTYAS